MVIVNRPIIPVICFIVGVLIGMQLTPAPEPETQKVSVKKPRSTRSVKVKNELGLESIYAKIKEPLLLNEDIPAVQKAVMLYDIETREAYHNVIDDKESDMQAELIVRAPLARKVLEFHLQKNPQDVIARALLVKYLVFASYDGEGTFDQTDLSRALTEVKIAAKENTQKSRVEMERLSVELSGFLEVCPSRYAKELISFLEQASQRIR